MYDSQQSEPLRPFLVAYLCYIFYFYYKFMFYTVLLFTFTSLACIFIGSESFCILKQFVCFELSGSRLLDDFCIFLKTNNMFHLIRGCRRLVCLQNQSLCGRFLLFHLVFIAQAWTFVFWKPINLWSIVIRKLFRIIVLFQW